MSARILLLWSHVAAWLAFHAWQTECLRLAWAHQRKRDALAELEQATLGLADAQRREQRAAEMSAVAFQRKRQREIHVGLGLR